MALTDESNGNGFYMPVAPAYGGGNGFGGFGGDWAWIIILLLACGGGWGFGGGFGGGYGNMMLGYDFPWLLNGQQNVMTNTNNGFRDQMINDNVTSIRDGVAGLSTQLCGCCGDIQNSLCSGFAGTTAAITNAQNALTQQMYTNQISDLERSFAAQTASTQGMNAIQSQLAQCCCDNRAATADLKYTVATEACADRAAINDALRDVISANTASTQRILDQLCQDKIDTKNDQIAQLRQELMFARGQASQDVQTATLRAGQVAEVDALYDRLSQCPISTVPVYGRQPIFQCNNGGCGCGCGVA